MAVGKKVEATFWWRAVGRKQGEQAGRSLETTAASGRIPKPGLLSPP